VPLHTIIRNTYLNHNFQITPTLFGVCGLTISVKYKFPENESTENANYDVRILRIVRSDIIEEIGIVIEKNDDVFLDKRMRVPISALKTDETPYVNVTSNQ
jgi:hypothetical protein